MEASERSSSEISTTDGESAASAKNEPAAPSTVSTALCIMNNPCRLLNNSLINNFNLDRYIVQSNGSQ